MKILVTGRGLDLGKTHTLGNFELDQAKALSSLGHDVRFAAIDTRSLRRRRPWGTRKFTHEGLDVHYCAVPVGAKPVALAERAQERAAASIFRALERENWRPDIIHSHFGAGFLTLAAGEGIPTVYTEHFSRTAEDVISPEELRREKNTYPRCTRLLCVSSALAKKVHERLGVEATVVPNVADPLFSSHADRLRGSETGFHFVSAGRLVEIKRRDILLRAMAKLPGDVRLTLIGDGELRAELEKLAWELGIAERVTFTGQLTRERMAEIYESADAFVLSSRKETFGVVFIEAMSMGLPAVATRCGGPEDVVNESNGILVANEDVEALAEGMLRMVRERDTFDSAAIARAAAQAYSPRTIAEKLTEIYGEVIKC